MLHILSALYGFVRLGPIGLGIGAAIMLGIGYFLQVSQNDRVAAEAAALAAGPPAAVDVAKFDRERDTTELREVMLRGQAVFDYAYELTLETDSGELEGFMVPIVSETAMSDKEVVAVAFFYERGFSHDRLTSAFKTRGVVGFGEIGPIFEYNGEIRSLGIWTDITEDVFAIEGLSFENDLLVVWPYLDGREVEFAPPAAGEMTMFGLFSKIAGAIGLLALGKLAFGNKAKPTQRADGMNASAVRANPDFEPIPPKNAFDAAPLWKQRSGLVEEGDYAAEPVRNDPLRFEEPVLGTATPKPARSAFGLRKVLIVIVGGLFFLGLAATVSDLIGKSSTASVNEAQAVNEVVAETAGEAIVPDANPDRHWTDIDVAPIVEWFDTKWMLAASGDAEAMMILGIIGFVAMFLPIGINMYFQSHRRRLRSRISTEMDMFG